MYMFNMFFPHIHKYVPATTTQSCVSVSICHSSFSTHSFFILPMSSDQERANNYLVHTQIIVHSFKYYVSCSSTPRQRILTLHNKMKTTTTRVWCVYVKTHVWYYYFSLEQVYTAPMCIMCNHMLWKKKYTTDLIHTIKHLM